MRRKTDSELIAEHGGKYALVMGVTRRAKQLNDGARPLVERSSLNNVATSIQEIALGRIVVLPPELPSKPAPLRPLPDAEAPEDA
jgi:DNA-directed RNA polymerase omega subunit